MKITEVIIHPSDEDPVRAYVSIVFDNCFLIRQIKVIKGKAGPFVSMPSRKQIDGTRVNIACPANGEMQSMIEKAVLTEYEKVVGGSVPLSFSAKS